MAAILLIAFIQDDTESLQKSPGILKVISTGEETEAQESESILSGPHS